MFRVRVALPHALILGACSPAPRPSSPAPFQVEAPSARVFEAPATAPTPNPVPATDESPDPAQRSVPPECTGGDLNLEALRESEACDVSFAESVPIAPEGLELQMPAEVAVRAGGGVQFPVVVRNGGDLPRTLDFVFGDGFPSASIGELSREADFGSAPRLAAIFGSEPACGYGAVTTSQVVRVVLPPNGRARLTAELWANEIGMQPIPGCTPTPLPAGTYVVEVSVEDRSHQAVLKGTPKIVVK